MADLRQEVLMAQLERTNLRDRSPAALTSADSATSATSAEDSDLVGVRTAPGTPTVRSRNPSSTGSNRSTSSTRHLESRHAMSPRHSPIDPLRRFPPEVAQRIFLSVPVETLAQCSLVSRHWRRSATLNYAWFRHWQEEERLEPTVTRGWGSYVSPHSGLLLPPLSQGGAKWTKRQSRTDWKKAYFRTLHTAFQPARKDYLSVHGIRTGSARVAVSENKSRSERMAESGVMSATAMRQQQWAEEARADAAFYNSKGDMRDVYKSYGPKGGKIKGKSGKGGTKAWSEFA